MYSFGWPRLLGLRVTLQQPFIHMIATDILSRNTEVKLFITLGLIV